MPLKSLKYSLCPSPSWASPRHKLPHSPLVGHTEVSTAVGLPATDLELSDACSGRGAGQGGSQARGAGTAMGQSGKPMKKPWASQKEQSQSLGSCSRHTKRTQVRALGLGLELQLPTLKAWLLGFGFFYERWGLWGQGPQNSRATTKGSPQRYRCDSSLE